METWDWIADSLLPNLYYTEDYRGAPLNAAYKEKFLANGVAMRLGPPRLRQIRNKPLSCVFGRSIRILRIGFTSRYG